MQKKKTVLLFSPHEIQKKGLCWQLLHIVKGKKGPEYEYEALSAGTITTSFGRAAQAFVPPFSRFFEKQLQTTIQEINDAVRKMPGVNGNAEDAFRQAFEKRLHQDFVALKPYLPALPAYHRVPAAPNQKLYRTGPCKFSAYTPGLQFQVRRAREGYLYLEADVALNGTLFPLKSFTQTNFLLESQGEYFLLRYTDYKTLTWLQQVNWEEEGADVNHFTEHIIKRLEQDYRIHRNGLLHTHLIETIPEGEVVLSELNQQFLMLTPRFDYDGFLAEGPFRETEVHVRDGKEYTIARNKAKEEEIIEQVLILHPNFKNQHNGYYYLSFEEAQKKNWFLKAFRHLLDLNIRIAGMDMLKHFRYCTDKPVTRLEVIKKEKDRFYISFSLQLGKENIAFADLQKLLRTGQPAIPLKDGSIALLDEEWMNQYGILVKHATINAQGISVPQWVAMALEHQEGAASAMPPVLKQEWVNKWQQWQTSDAPLYALPSTVNATLRTYQQKGYEWIRLMQELGAGTLLADDMGLGKTLQTICFIAHVAEQQPGGKVLVVCPASLIYNWQHELSKFTPSLQVYVYHGAGRNKEVFADNKVQVVITTYGTLRTDDAVFLPQIFSLVVLDESHAIKNPDAQITKVAHHLQADRRVILSGTPVMNNTFDLFSQLHFILPGMFGSQQFFKREYADPIDVHKNEQRIRVLQRLTAPFILRRTKEQVATDLPPKSEITLWCRMTDAQQQIYEEVKDAIRNDLRTTIREKGLEQSKMQVVNGILKLRQVCNSPALLKDSAYHCNESAKLEELMNEIANNLSNHKALVFSQFTSMLDIIAAELQKSHIPYLLLTGSTSAKERDRMVQEFNAPDSQCRVFLLSLKAGNAGLNLTAADYVFLFDPWWNNAVEQQAIDRTHRIGQTKSVFAYKMICKDSIEEKIVLLQQEKKHLAGELVREDDGFVKGLTEEDIEFLFT
jgi:superfamily II DNA or RNA helicase